MTERRLSPWVWLILAIVAAIISWSYMHRVLLPWENYVNVTHGRLKAQMGDLYPRWVGTRELLLNGRNPYGPEVSQEIQVGFYGHPIIQSYDKPASEIVDEQRFAYPLYVVFLLAPTVHMDFALLEDWAPVLFALLTALSVWLWMSVLRWNPPAWVLASTILFVLATPQIAQGLRLRQFGLLVAFLIALAGWCVSREHHFFGGVLLALATIKPQMVLLCVAWFLIWSLGEWRNRWPIVAVFAGMLAALVTAGLWLVPGWPRQFLEGLQAYRRYFPTTSPLRLVLGDWLGGILSIVLVIGVLAFSWRNRKASADSLAFAETLALYFVVTLLALPLLTPYNHVLLLLPALLLLRDWDRIPRPGRIAFIVLLALPWAASLVLLLHPPAIESTNRLPLLPSSAVLLFPFLIAGLMYVRLQRVE